MVEISPNGLATIASPSMDSVEGSLRFISFSAKAGIQGTQINEAAKKRTTTCFVMFFMIPPMMCDYQISDGTPIFILDIAQIEVHMDYFGILKKIFNYNNS